tara:strand:+ start:807 stop:1163 length:357 start_codon:yes stop_codon:yes gene_type:complete
MSLFKRNNRAFKKYKKSANTRKNEWRRWSRWHPSRRKPLSPELVMAMWVGLPVDPNNPSVGDLDAEPLMETELRKQEADATNYFLIENNQPMRYEPKARWLENKWKKRLTEDGESDKL